MKKPVILIIGLIYIIAIVVVGFLGIPARVYNPKTFVTDIELTFDDKLEPLSASEGVDYSFRISSNDTFTFDIVAKVKPDEASEKRCVFEQIDNYGKDVYTFTTTVNEKSGYTIASFTCAKLKKNKRKTISVSVRPADGNKSLRKTIDILLKGI